MAPGEQRPECHVRLHSLHGFHSVPNGMGDRRAGHSRLGCATRTPRHCSILIVGTAACSLTALTTGRSQSFHRINTLFSRAKSNLTTIGKAPSSLHHLRLSIRIALMALWIAFGYDSMIPHEFSDSLIYDTLFRAERSDCMMRFV